MKTMEMALAEIEMLRGVGCGEDGDGPCGTCIKCANERADAMALEHAREHERAQALAALLCKAIATWPRTDQSMGKSYIFCPACGLACTGRGDECLLAVAIRLGLVDQNGNIAPEPVTLDPFPTIDEFSMCHVDAIADRAATVVGNALAVLSLPTETRAIVRAALNAEAQAWRDQPIGRGRSEAMRTAALVALCNAGRKLGIEID